MATGRIDRKALVTRHSPHLDKFNFASPLSVGNGEFAFTADPTGLQTFFPEYEKAMPLCTQSQWGWHSFPMPRGMSIADMKLEEFDTAFGRIGYPNSSKDCKEIYAYGRQNPHRLHLGRIGFDIRNADGRRAEIADISDIDQTLDLWAGLLTSSYKVGSSAAKVLTAVHPNKDMFAARIDSQMLSEARMAIELEFPGPLPNAVTTSGQAKEDSAELDGWVPPDKWSDFITAADWSHPEKHRTFVTFRQTAREGGRADFLRAMDNDKYFVALKWKGNATLTQSGPHKFILRPIDEIGFEFVCVFSPQPARDILPTAAETFEAAKCHWAAFWSTGGAVELAGSTDPRANELERRIVLSQYLTAIQCSGTTPPQETGLTCNSWYGKYNLEMHYWHAQHFPLWGRPHLLQRSLWWYQYHLPRARRMAKRVGLKGARWTKLYGPDDWDLECPGLGPTLIWCQPHPIGYAEMMYKSRPEKETLDQYKDVVLETAECMASFAVWDDARKRYILAPPIVAAQECYPKATVLNPTYEVAYWRWGLEMGQTWRERLGLGRDAKWDEILAKLAPLPVFDGVYVGHENAPDTFKNFNVDHPTMLSPLGMLPGGKHVDIETMRRTLHKVLKEWNLAKKSWGWDYPMIAMTAARLGEQKIAVDSLLNELPQNQFVANGHNPTRSDLSCYLPANGALLMAVSMMAAGWQGGPKMNAPGFPQDGSWVVRHEGLNPWM
jgi:protein-glucosylgalactosylhydroxylysine glucosidase